MLKALNQLEDEGKIVRNDKNEYLLIENSNYIVGVLHINKRGFGFVIIDEESDDIFISSRDLKDAFNISKILSFIFSPPKKIGRLASYYSLIHT